MDDEKKIDKKGDKNLKDYNEIISILVFFEAYQSFGANQSNDLGSVIHSGQDTLEV